MNRPPAYALAVTMLLGILASPGQAAQDSPLPEVQEANLPKSDEPANQATEDSPYKLKIDATLVNVEALVNDEDGRVLAGLKKENFRILDNGVPQNILNFAPTSAPMTIVLLLEYSAASYDYFAYKGASWSSGFLDHLEPRDWVSLVTYDIRSKVQVDFTHKRFEVRDALTTLGPPGFSESNLFDALIDTLDKLEGVHGRKSILLIATGANSFSSATLDEVLDRLKRSDVTIFCIGLAEQEYVRSGGSSTSYLQAKSWLSTFAKRTGGLALFPRFQGELPDIYRSVVGFLRSEYTLSFRPPKESRDGRYHRLRVEVVGADGKPLKATDEKGKQHKVEVYAREGYTAPKDKSP